jgi:oxalate decarboxylase
LWPFYIAGKGRMTVFFPVDNAKTMDFNHSVGYGTNSEPSADRDAGND